jgi:hypothetical protein
VGACREALHDALASDEVRGTLWCEAMTRAVVSDDIPLRYIAKFREFGISVLDGGTSYIRVSACPWCGGALPDSLRDDWFSELRRRGIDPATDAIPPEFTDERWYVSNLSDT